MMAFSHADSKDWSRLGRYSDRYKRFKARIVKPRKRPTGKETRYRPSIRAPAARLTDQLLKKVGEPFFESSSSDVIIARSF
ncbi:hypothetical protein I5S86_14580 [Priestia aryabhattai]|jgi:hypothetical protein|nr:hypothetical protein I5S86_14580 [Priestia aryabhattai]